MPVPRPAPDDNRLSPGEKREFRDAALAFGPAVLAAFVLRWALVTNLGWAPGRALLVSIGVGIVLALLLQRALGRQAR
jgi:hypothetical protein